MKKDALLYFKHKPTSERSQPNAAFIRDMGVLNGEKVIEINYQETKWLVRETEVTPAETAWANLLSDWKSQIDAMKEPKQFKKQLAAKLGWSTYTLRTRVKLIESAKSTP